MKKNNFLVNILAGKTGMAINDTHVEFVKNINKLDIKVGKRIIIIDVIMDHSDIIINDIDSLHSVLEERRLVRGYRAFANKHEILQAISFIKRNISLITDLATQAGWYTEPEVVAEPEVVEEPKQAESKPFSMKSVRCITTGQVFPSMKIAANTLGCNVSGVSKCCRGIRKTTNGLRFEYAN